MTDMAKNKTAIRKIMPDAANKYIFFILRFFTKLSLSNIVFTPLSISRHIEEQQVFKHISKIIIVSLSLTSTAYSLPIDWHGTFGVDSTSIDQFRRIESKTYDSNNVDDGSQEVALRGAHHRASWQSYLFRLSPEIIINDAATFKGEITNGYPRGGRLGDNVYKSKEGSSFGNALYYHNTSFPGSENKLVLNKFFMELYSDTATYLIGRHSNHWGLGAVFNEGSERWDRHTSTRDGITMKLKVGNFSFEPYWAKISSYDDLTRASNSRHWGIGLLYDNPDREIAFGLQYSIMKIASGNSKITTGINGSNSAIGESNVKLIDLYFKKTFDKFTMEVEAPIFSGEMGTIYGAGSTKYKARAVLLETEYKIDNSWSVGLDAGTVSGDDGGRSSFDAMYLHPNYQVANLLFRYNTRAVSKKTDQDFNVYDSYMTNVQYLKLSGKYEIDKWAWEAAILYAKASETAEKDKAAFNHTTNKAYDAEATQESDYGMELDFNFKYKWNQEIHVDGGVGYLMTGDYFAFNNTATPNVAKDSYLLQIRASLPIGLIPPYIIL